MRELVATVVLGCLLGLIGAGPLQASEFEPTLEELEAEVMCPTCNAPLNRSHAPAAARIRAFIVNRIALGDTKSEIKGQLVVEFGERALTSPTRSGINTIVWALPLVGIVGAGVVVFVILRRWSRARAARAALAGDGLDPELERRIDDELSRFAPS